MDSQKIGMIVGIVILIVIIIALIVHNSTKNTPVPPCTSTSCTGSTVCNLTPNTPGYLTCMPIPPTPPKSCKTTDDCLPGFACNKTDPTSETYLTCTTPCNGVCASGTVCNTVQNTPNYNTCIPESTTNCSIGGDCNINAPYLGCNKTLCVIPQCSDGINPALSNLPTCPTGTYCETDPTYEKYLICNTPCSPTNWLGYCENGHCDQGECDIDPPLNAN